MSSSDERRLWIGNLDPRVTEYQLLKLTQKYGKIEKFDLLFHKTGSLAGLPRGYAFVTYSKAEEAQRAKAMHNTLLGNKNIIVTWAHSMPTDVHEDQKKAQVNIPALAISKSGKSDTDKKFQIQAIEAKLKLMENQSSKELEINKTVSQERPVIEMYQQNKQTSSANPFNQRNRSQYNRKPYDRSKRK